MIIDVIKNKSLTGTKSWQLISCTLNEYLDNLPSEAFDFDIQRRIVKNTYLDKLYQTIINGDPMPMISLSCRATDDKFSLDECDILDGLQRTFRLCAIKRILEVSKALKSTDASYVYEFLKRNVNQSDHRYIESGVIKKSVIRKLLDSDLASRLETAFAKYELFLSVWFGLTDEEVVSKMLTLNAGQIRINSTHQYELMFLHFFKSLQLPEKMTLVRDREPEFFATKKGKRQKGFFLLSSIVVALQSYVQKKPLRIQPVNNLRIEDSVIDETTAEYFTAPILESFLRIFPKLEKISSNAELTSWLLKDTTLSGLFAALGEYLNSTKDFDSIIDTIKLLNESTLNYEYFEKAYSNLSSVKINVGNIVRKAIYHYFINLFKNTPISWEKAFEYKSEEDV